MTLSITVNNRPITIPQDKADMPLLWFIREEQKLKGTKFGCGIGQCGACTVHVNGAAVRSCTVTVSQLSGATVTTIEGLADENGTLHPLQQAWMDIDVPQCGYCQTGQIMAAAALLAKNDNPSDENIDQGMTNICRCGSYTRIRQAIKQAAAVYRKAADNKIKAG